MNSNVNPTMNHYGNLRGRRPSRSATRSRSAGFTLLELLLVLSILVVVGGIAAVNIFSAGDTANRDTTMVQLRSLKPVISMYKVTMSTLPDTLENLIEGPSDAAQQARWTGSLLDVDEVPTDAWGREIIYTVEGNTFELRSGGIDGQINTEDDLIVTG